MNQNKMIKSDIIYAVQLSAIEYSTVHYTTLQHTTEADTQTHTHTQTHTVSSTHLDTVQFSGILIALSIYNSNT